MKNLTFSKMSLSDNGKFLYAILDECKCTIIQVWAEKDPVDIIEKLTKK